MVYCQRLSTEQKDQLSKALSDYPTEVGQAHFEKENKLLGKLPDALQRDGEIRKLDDYLDIIWWKSPRSAGKYAERDQEKIRRQSAEAFAYAQKGDLENTVESLTSPQLRGVGVRIATALLMFYDPNSFTVMDINAWRSLVYLGVVGPFSGWEKATDYREYLDACIVVQELFDHSLRETDRALWTLGAQRGKVRSERVKE